MLTVIVVVAVVLLAWWYFKGKSKSAPEAARDTTPALDAFLREALEIELAKPTLGIDNATPEERRRLARTLANEPDADVVSKIEDLVKAVDLEYVKYAHEKDAEVTVRVRYADGKSGATSRRLAWDDVPEPVRKDFLQKGSTRVFRTWVFPWQRAVAL
jgi:hypothetical protein